MDSFKGQGGIQMLLTAEQEAQSIISNARNMKMSRLKQAKNEADREVANYRSNLETDYQNQKSEMSSGTNAKRLEEETEVKIQNLKESATTVSSDIVGMLLKCVTTVKT